MTQSLYPKKLFSRRVPAIFVLTLLACIAAPAQIVGPQPTPANTKQGTETKPTEAQAAGVVKAAPSVVTRRFEQGGVSVEFTLASPSGVKGGITAGSDAIATFRVTDKATGSPVAGLHPNAWIGSLKTGQPVPGDAECKDRVRSYMGGLMSVRADIDMNGFLVVSLNHDNTVTFINPQVAFNITKLESIVELPGRGADWALTPDKNFLYVSMPEASAVAVIDTVTRKLVATVPLGRGAAPRRLALSPDGSRLWVGLDGSPLVAILDAGTHKLLTTIDVGGGGLHSFAFTQDGRHVYVSNSDGTSVAAVDARALRKVADIAVGQTPGPIAYSTASRNVYVAAVNGESISVIDPARQSVVASIPVKRGTVALRFAPDGRYAFAVNQGGSVVTVIDAATNTVVGSTEVVKSPDQVVFTNEYAYVRGVGSEKFTLIGLKEVAAGKLSPVDVQAGQRPPAESPDDLGVADMIAATPEGNSAMIANAPDAMIYYYVQGMMAPMGTLSNYKRRPRALMVLDRSLSEVSPGVYSAPLKMAGAGRFAVSLLIDQPRVLGCTDLEIAEAPGVHTAPGTSLLVEPEFDGMRATPSRPVALRFKLRDRATGQPVTGLRDVQVLVFEPPGIWQQRQWAKELGGGIYEVSQTFPHAGLFNVMFKIESRGLNFRNLPFANVKVLDEGATEVKSK